MAGMTPTCRLLILIVLVLLYEKSSSFLPHKYGVLHVNHEIVFIGETVMFYCRVTDQRLQAKSSDIYIRASGSDSPIGRVVHRDTSSVTINMTVTSVNDTGTYYCTVNETTRGRTGLGNAILEVEYPLKPVTDFTCVTQRFLTLICNYTLPVAFRYPDEILGQVLYSLHDYEDPVSVCYNGTDRTFTLEQGHNLFATYQFQVRLLHLSRLTAVTSKNFTIDPMSVGIPSRVTQLKVNDVTSTSLNLSWRHPDTVHNYICRVTCAAKWKHNTLVVMTNSTGHVETQQTRFESLIPGVRYTIAVQCQTYSPSTGKTFGFFSDKEYVVCKTPDDVPGAAPRLAPAVSRPTDTQIIFYWQPLDAKDEHGTLRNYVVRVTDQHGRTEQTTVGKNQHSFPVQLRSPRDEIHFSVQVVNNIGPSPVSTLTVKSLNNGGSGWVQPGDVRFWVTGNPEESRVTFHWESMGKTIAACTVYWCEGLLTARNCQNPISWKSVRCDLQNVTIDTGHRVGDQHLLVGFSVNPFTATGTVQNSIKWDYCIYVPGRVPQAPEGFSLSQSQPPRGIQVEWKGNDCRANPVYISEYIISYCVAGSGGRCTGPVNRETVSRQVVSYLLKDLKATQYRVTIRAMSHEKEGPDSIPVITNVQDEKNILVIILPTSILTGAIITVLLIVGFKKLIDKWRQPVVIEYPPGMFGKCYEETLPMDEKKPRFSKRRKGWSNFFQIHLVPLIPNISQPKRQSYISTTVTDSETSSGETGSLVEATPFCDNEEYMITAEADNTQDGADEFSETSLDDFTGPAVDASGVEVVVGSTPVDHITTRAIVEEADDNKDIAESCMGTPVPGSDMEYQQITILLQEGPVLSRSGNPLSSDQTATQTHTGHSPRVLSESQTQLVRRENQTESKHGSHSDSGNSQYVQVGDIFGDDLT